MTICVLALMQDPGHVQHPSVLSKIDHMRSRLRLAGAGAQFDRAAGRLVRSQRQAVPLQLVDVAIGLIRVPVPGGVIPDPNEIGAGGRGEAEELRHPPRSARRSALKATMSRGSGAPEASPPSRAVWRASTRLSCSSRSRNPARTTSLAEP